MPLARRSRVAVAGLLLTVCLVASPAGSSSAQPAPARAYAAAICGDHPNQAAAQRAADTRYADGDGLYCESLPCPCLAPGPSRPPPTPSPAPSNPSSSQPTATPTCASPAGVQPISFSRTRYPTIRRHFRAALRRGWPRTLVLNRPGADARRERLLRGFPTREGFDRDEYPPAIGRGRGQGLRRGTHPRGWKADVRYAQREEPLARLHARDQAAALLRGTRFHYVFY